MWRLVWWRLFKKLQILISVCLFLFQFSEAQDLHAVNLTTGITNNLEYFEPNFPLNYKNYREINMFEYTDKKRLFATWKIDSTGKIFSSSIIDNYCNCENKKRNFIVTQTPLKKVISSVNKTNYSKEYFEKNILFDSLNRIYEITLQSAFCFGKNCKKNKYDTSAYCYKIKYPDTNIAVLYHLESRDTIRLPFKDIPTFYKDSLGNNKRLIKRKVPVSILTGFTGPALYADKVYTFLYDVRGKLDCIEEIFQGIQKRYILNYNEDGSLAGIFIDGHPHYTFEYKPNIQK